MLRVGGVPRKQRPPTHPARVRDASAIPCSGALGVRAERRVGTFRRYHQGWCLTGAKASTVWLFFRISLLFSCSPFGGLVVVQTLKRQRRTSRT